MTRAVRYLAAGFVLGLMGTGCSHINLPATPATAAPESSPDVTHNPPMVQPTQPALTPGPDPNSALALPPVPTPAVVPMMSPDLQVYQPMFVTQEPAYYSQQTPVGPTPVVPTEVPDIHEPAEPPAPKSEDLVVRVVRSYRENRTTEAAELLQQFDPSRRELIQTMLAGLAKVSEHRSEPLTPTETTAVLDQYNQLGLKMCPRAALVLAEVRFCRSIDGFGMYEPLPDDHRFQAGTPGQVGELVQVYLELRHFASQITGAYHETVLRSSLEIRDRDHKVQWRCDSPARPTRSRTARQDCFLNCHFAVPPMPPGDYSLWIQVKDLTGTTNGEPPAHRIATQTLNFRVGSQARAGR